MRLRSAFPALLIALLTTPRPRSPLENVTGVRTAHPLVIPGEPRAVARVVREGNPGIRHL
jgi:hypothetical protein